METILIIIIALFFLWGAIAIVGGFWMLGKIVRCLERGIAGQPNAPIGT
jgi:hypothetical protein